jgi:hypothetical protein
MTKSKHHQDAKHSTTTAKKLKAKNALVHGVYSRDLLMPWESREDFEKLHADLRAEFHPDGPMEEETVLDVACLRWNKQRVRKMWTAATYNDPFAIELIESGKKSWSGIHKYLRRQARDFHSMTGSLHELYSSLANQATKVSRALSKEEEEKADNESAHQQIEAILSTMDRHVLPLIRNLQAGPNAEQTLGKAYSPEYLEPILKIEALIDGRIDKALGRLANLKAYKELVRAPARLPSPSHGQAKIEFQSPVRDS